MADELELLQGTLDVLVLRALQDGPRHGYDVARWIRSRSGDELRVEDGALYTALHRMAGKGWLASEWGTSESNRRARFYRLTDQGRRQLTRQEKSWTRYAEAVSRVLESGHAGS